MRRSLDLDPGRFPHWRRAILLSALSGIAALVLLAIYL